MKKLIILTAIACSSMFKVSKAQDLHYSQHVYNPLYYNPAFTGYIHTKGRVYASYADRYRQSYGDDGIKTFFASGDLNIPITTGTGSKSNIGVGAYFYNHRAGENAIMDNVSALTAAYRLSLDKESKHTISVGFNFSFSSRSYNYSSLRFGNQYDGFDYNPTIRSGELNDYPNKNKIDVGIGLLYAFAPSKVFKGYAGASVFHLIPDNDQVISYGNGLRYNAHAGLELDFKDISIQPSIMVDHQSKALELYTGILMKYYIVNKKDDKVSLYAGPYFRMYKSPIGAFSMYTLNVMGGIQYNDFQLFVAADNTLNSSKNVFGGFNGFEVGLNYNFGQVNTNSKMYCPTFR